MSPNIDPIYEPQDEGRLDPEDERERAVTEFAHRVTEEAPTAEEAGRTLRDCRARFTEAEAKRHLDPPPHFGGTEPPDAYLNALALIAQEDVSGLLKAQESYGDSWKRRGGVGAFMMLARKWDRLENAMTAPAVERYERQHGDGTTHPESRTLDRYDIFKRTLADGRAEGLIDDIRDLRRYLLLVEGELRAQGLDLKHRDNG